MIKTHSLAYKVDMYTRWRIDDLAAISGYPKNTILEALIAHALPAARGPTFAKNAVFRICEAGLLASNPCCGTRHAFISTFRTPLTPELLRTKRV